MGASWAPRPRGGFAPEPKRPKPAPKKRPKPRAPRSRRRRRPGGHPPRRCSTAAGADADPRLPRARPSGGPARPAGLQVHEGPSGAGPQDLRLHRGRSGPADLHRPVLGLETATLRQIIAAAAPPIAAISASSSCTSRTRSRSPGSSSDRGRALGRSFDAGAKRKILTQLTEAEGFEAFCAKKYVGTKRFGLEGGESTIPAVLAVIETGAEQGVNEIVIGMAHRGRLNVLVNVVKKPFVQVFSEFKGSSFKPDDVQGSGDVKYHLGTSTDIEIGGRPSTCRCSRTRRTSRREPRRGGQGPRAPGPGGRHQDAHQRHGHPAAWRRRLRRPGPGL
jgi:2-oxoglutarate dehydrogenase E1 component